ncbi:MAG: GNAT family N-acetyltransferase [Pirellulales bacterium]|nr:GNAT family N-acetyltransferase [Pirellulales bacterium]
MEATAAHRPMISVRRAAIDDVPLILSLIRELAEYERLAHTVDATEEHLRRTLFGQPAEAEVLIGEFQGEPAGLALFFSNYSTFKGRSGIYLEDLFVRPHARGSGLGKALLRSVASIAAQRGCVRLEWSVLDWNQPAIDFYKRLGAQPLDEWTVYRMTGEGIAALVAE